MRTHYCGEVTESLIGQDVAVCGWVHGRRDHGGVIFIDLRDREGLLQVVFDPDTPEIFQVAEHVRSEYVLKVEGRVRQRPVGMQNPALRTGQVEVVAGNLVVLSRAETPPFHHDEQTSEEMRLRFRYLDLRREAMQRQLRLRHRTTQALRGFLDEQGFIDIETPMLTKATPEGARDYLVPSRTHPGRFFALPQSPQIFKQLLMMSGFDRYYQIVRCFRDEDLRADRQPEFTQLDIETTFMNEEAIMTLMEQMIRHTFKEVLGIDLPDPFPRMTYAHALERYGTDRPDLRNPLVLEEISDLVAEVEFKVFAGPAKDPAGRVCAMKLPDGARLTRKELDDLTPFVQRFGAKGVAYIRINDRDRGRDGLQSPILKFLDDTALENILERTAAETGDVVFFGAGPATVVNQAMSALREKLAADLELSQEGWQPLWIIEFPMFEWDTREKRWSPLHHPFTSPAVEEPQALEADPGEMKSRAYDMVLNGSEIGGGSIRIHDQAMQSSVFNLLDIGEEEARDRFGFLLDALKYGCPPHGGIAFGLDRLVMLMSGAESIREVIAFPKTQTASCPLTGAPATVPDAQLMELGIRLGKREKNPP